MYTVPSPRTLPEYHSQFPIYPGLNETILAEMKQKFDEGSTENKIVDLLVDEVYFLLVIHYDPTSDQFIGVTNVVIMN